MANGYVVDHSGEHFDYLEAHWWDEWHRRYPKAWGTVGMSQIARDEKTGVVLLYVIIGRDGKWGSGTVVAYDYRDGRLRKRGEVMLWVS